MNTIVFKQSYKSPNLKATAVLNQKHLEYISTRKGVMTNPGCGHGLWGRLPGERTPQEIDDLRVAKKIIGEASRATPDQSGKTMYRAVISVDKDMAEQFDLYNREAWTRYINKNVDVLAKEQGINQGDFCWVAAAHYKKNHPHVHIVYWDNSNRPREPHMHKARFERFSDNVRASFNRDFHREQLKDLQSEQNRLITDTRQSFRGFLGEYGSALDLERISQKQLEPLAEKMEYLITHLPTSGSLRYQYLPKHYKEHLDEFIDQVLTIPQFDTQYQQFLKVTNDISTIYGNSDTLKAENLETASAKFRNKIANEAMTAIRDYMETIPTQVVSSTTIPGLKKELSPIVKQLLTANADLYREYLDALPKSRTPWYALQDDKNLQELERKLIQAIRTDIRLRKPVETFKASRKDPEFEAKLKDLRGQTKNKDPTVREKAKEAYEDLKSEDPNKDVEKEVYETIKSALHDQAEVAKNYNFQLSKNVAISALLRMFGSGSNSRGAAQNKRDNLLSKRRNLSGEAKKDLKAQRAFRSSWDFDM